MAATVLVWAATFIAQFFIDNPKTERSIFWLGWLGGGVLGALSALFRGWTATAAVFGLVLFAAVVYAYCYTSYLTIGGRVYTLFERNARPEPPTDASPRPPRRMPARDSYGGLSAAKFWWIVVALMAIAAVGVYLGGWAWQGILLTAFLAAVAALCGIDDATRRLPIVRRQYVQAVIATGLSIPLYGAPPAIYLLGYLIGRRRPMGYGRHDQVAQYYRELDERGRDGHPERGQP
jgi:hypothetical protein